LRKLFLAQFFSLGIYQYYWFFRNYKQFRLHKDVKVSPFLETLSLMVMVGIVPPVLMYLFSLLSSVDRQAVLLLEIVSHLVLAVFMGLVFYRQFAMITGSVRRLGFRSNYIPRQLALIMGSLFLFHYFWMRVAGSGEESVYSWSVYDWLAVFIGWGFMAMISGWILIRVQRVLNFIWRTHQKRSYGALVITPVSWMEKLAIAGMFLASLALWSFFFFLFLEIAGVIQVMET
jgi:hypothetical protein